MNYTENINLLNKFPLVSTNYSHIESLDNEIIPITLGAISPIFQQWYY